MKIIVDFQLSDIINKIQGDYQALVLFGSYARCEEDKSSDVDILQIVNKHRKSYSIGKINISVYTIDHLLNMCKNGDLFILHLLNEGIVLSSQIDILEILLKEFVPQKNYEEYRNKVKCALKLLDIDEVEYTKESRKYIHTAIYLFRSYLFSILHDNGNLTFSTKQLSKIYNDDRIEELIGFKDTERVAFNEYLNLISLIEDYVGETIKNEFLSLESLIVNLYYCNSLLVILGLRILNTSEEVLPYGVIEQELNLI